MNRQQRRKLDRTKRRKINRDMQKGQPAALTPVPQDKWPPQKPGESRIEVWRSRDYLVQVFAEEHDVIRLSVSRARVNRDGHWEDDLSWDELQRIKREIGYGNVRAFEVFPCDDDVVNVANMRHLWILPDGADIPPFGWKRKDLYEQLIGDSEKKE